MRADRDLYNEMAAILIDRGPPNSSMLRFNFEILAELGSDEGGGWRCDFDYVDSEGKETWFLIDSADAVDTLCELALALRKLMRGEAEPVWKSMVFKFDLVSRVFNAQFYCD